MQDEEDDALADRGTEKRRAVTSCTVNAHDGRRLHLRERVPTSPNLIRPSAQDIQTNKPAYYSTNSPP